MDDQRTGGEGGLTVNDKWIVVVEPMAQAASELAMADWLQRQAESGISYAPDEIRLDMLCAKGCEREFRYLVLSKEK